MANWIGKRLGKVQIEALVARGGIAEVYVGTHLGLERRVAVKLLRSLHADDTDALTRFQREARVIARLRHSNIVQVHDFDAIENEPYLVMEYIEGPSLSHYLKVLHKNNQRLGPLHIIRLMKGVASALQYAHNHGVVHRDVKPGNILLTSPTRPIELGKQLPDDFEPVLTDFGLVRLLDSNRETTTGHVAGTPAYMSPEQARGEETDSRTDIYSLGIVLYELLAGNVPFDGETTVSILLKHVNDPPPPIPGLSPLIADVLERALAKDRRERYSTPVELADAFRLAVETGSDLATIQNSLPITTGKHKAVRPRPASGLRSQLTRIALLGLVALGLGTYLFLDGLPASQAQNDSPTLPGASPSATSTVSPGPPSATATQFVFVPLGPSAMLRFQNAAATGDQVVLNARAMPAALPGKQYEVWLTDGRARVSLGYFAPDEYGEGELIFTSAEGFDLLARYDRVEITLEPNPDPSTSPSDFVGYSYTFSEEALLHLRYLLSAFPSTPENISLMQGLYRDAQDIHGHVLEMQSAFRNGQREAMLKNAEDALNILVGAQSAQHQDWNGDGSTQSGEQYGLLLNGSNFGYIQAVYTEADYTIKAPGAGESMIAHGEVVKACVQNIAAWAPQLRDSLLTILNSSASTDLTEPVEGAVLLAEYLFKGLDLDENGQADAVPGECGMQLAYEHAYHMADMPLSPISQAFELTAIAASTEIALLPTRTPGPPGENTPVGVSPQPNTQDNPTPQPKKTKQPNDPGPGGDPGGKPTKKPKKP